MASMPFVPVIAVWEHWRYWNKPDATAESLPGGELRTDAWGALRGARGLTLSTWPLASPAAPAGDMAPAMALIQQADTLAQTLSKAAGTHRTVELACAIGTTAAGRCRIDDQAAPLKALHRVARGMVDAADTVTEMKLIKHAFQAGVPAQRGIED